MRSGLWLCVTLIRSPSPPFIHSLSHPNKALRSTSCAPAAIMGSRSEAVSTRSKFPLFEDFKFAWWKPDKEQEREVQYTAWATVLGSVKSVDGRETDTGKGLGGDFRRGGQGRPRSPLTYESRCQGTCGIPPTSQ